MARTARPIASVKRTSAARSTKSSDASAAASSSSRDTLASVGLRDTFVSLNPSRQTGTLVDQSHNIPINRTATLATPSFIVGQRISVQLRTDIWIPGTIRGFAFSQLHSSDTYDVEFYAADGSRCCRRFLSRDVRSE